MKTQVKLGKKYMIRIPKGIAEELDLKEGTRFILRVRGDEMILKPIRDPVWLAIHGKKFATISPEEVERISEEEQSRTEGE
ncbi:MULTISPECIES: AbrB/MazE/SpoVT family DNA-binding domain-containing protein [Metallosphaera]|nr:MULTISPECIES: AbrB/MazE/SpoVT family DNA-binding domain-containing protein [Metallosphaera]MCY0861516.1 AbrB/MazE/SpoVT family DNA-binding domain-containing protein [Metallosphaera prunae]QCO29463.1 AbrB/MazE/SpoVT family DNA-binding domain-containing protein [Metallosphaera prunae]WPX07059.1 AbrB/MazE/SpoVT family DNA-binding domain-containing protein [Metallosphaera sedula DSM 5348]